MDELLREIIRNNIRNRRNALNMPLDELADLVKLSPGYIGSIERGEKNGSIETLCSIAKALNYEIADLFTDNNTFNRVDPLQERIIGYLGYLDNDDREHILDVCRFLKVKKDKQTAQNESPTDN